MGEKRVSRASIVADLITDGHHILMMQYGETWRTMRKLIHQYFMESRCEKEHVEVQDAEGNTTETRRYKNLIKETIFKSTMELTQGGADQSFCLSVFIG